MRRLLIAALLASAPVPAGADTLIDNIDGMSADKDGKIQRFAAILVGDDGRIVQTFARGDKKPKKTTYAVDGKGRFVLPGMIDSHGHVMAMGIGALTLDLSATRTLAEALTRIAAYSRANPDRPWIIGRGWNQEVWGLGRYPTAAELDAAVGDRPVWLERADGHAGWANSRAMAQAGITAATRDVPGGRIERAAGGKPAGVFVDAATSLFDKAIPAPRPEDRDLALSKAQVLLMAKGVTTIADMGTSIEDWQAFRRAGDSGRLNVRIVSYALGIDNMVLIGGPGPGPWLYDDRLKLNGIKLYLDGALGSRGAWLKAPYADAPGQTGNRLLTDTQLKNTMSRAAIDHFQIAIHAIGDAANAAALDAIEDLAQTYKGDRRWRIEHAQVVQPADMARFGKSGVIASMQPVHQTSDRTMAEARLGPDRLAGAYAWASLKRNGATLVFGSDVPVEAADPFAGIAAAISRQGPDGQPAGGWQAQERVDLGTALAAYSSTGAWGLFAEDRFGRIEKGQRADFIMVDRDLSVATPDQIRATKVLQTWIGGRVVYDASRPPAK
jgi:predicted amidohydrolase YtcJ